METATVNSVLEQPWWLDAVAPGQWEEAVVQNEEGRITARLPYCIRNKRIFMPPYTQCLGVWFADQGSSPYYRCNEEKEQIGALLDQLSNKAKHISIRLYPSNQYVLPYYWRGFRLIPHFTYRINDLSDCSRIYADFHKTTKKNIKSAKNKVTIREDPDPARLFSLLDKTFEAQGRSNPMDKETLRRIIEACGEHRAGKLLIAEDAEGNAHSGAFLAYDENVCYYLFAGSDPKFRSSGAQSLVLWQAIQFASGRSRVFDFEGSMIESIEVFFRRFGCESTLYYEVKKQSLFADLLDMAKPRLKRLLHYK